MDRLIDRLGSDSPEPRAAALRELLSRYQSWSASELEKLARASEGSDLELTRRSAEALSRIRIRRELGPDLVEQIPDLDAALHFRGEDDRLWALKQVGARIKKGGMNSKAREFVLSRVGTPPPAGKALEFIRFVFEEHLRQFAPLLAPYLRDDRSDVRAAALRALGWLNAREFQREIAERLSMDPAASIALAELGVSECLDRLLELIKSEDLRFSHEAALALGILGDRHAVAPLVLLLDSEDVKLRVLATLSLAMIGESTTAPRLARLLKDPHAGARQAAVAALIAVRSAEVFEDVRPLLQDPSDEVRKLAAVYLSKMTPLDGAVLRDRVAAEIQSALIKPGVELWTVSIQLGDAAPRPLKKYLEWAIKNPPTQNGCAAMLLDALARTLEPSAYRKLTRRVELRRSIESLDDARTFFRNLGFELEASDGFGGRINSGVQVDGEQLLIERFPSGTGFVLHKDRVVVAPWEQALREWIRKIDRE